MSHKITLVALAALATLCHPAPSRAAVQKRRPATRKPPAARPAPALLPDVVSLTLEPGSIALNGPRDLQHLVVTAATRDGATHDVTSQARFTLGNSRLAKLAVRRVSPSASGSSTPSASF
ncbi:MAG: hypothetical protein ACO1SX_07210, partial [Actinomycetota bacterium]